MNETKLEKVNERLYHEPHKDGKPIKWVKRLCPLYFALTDIRVQLCLDIERPETSFPRGYEIAEANEKAEQGNTPTSREDESVKYSEDFGWRIRATGHLDKGDTIGLIRQDGTVTSHAERFHSMDVVLRTVSESEKQEACGNLAYCDARYERRETPYLSFYLFVPQTQLEKLCNEIASGRLSAMEVMVHADVFMSEIDMLFSEPGMSRRFYVEEATISNRAYVSWLVASRSLAGATPGGGEVGTPVDRRESFEAEGFSEHTTSVSGKWLIKFLARFFR